MLRRLVALIVALAGSLVIVFVTASIASADCVADPVTGEVHCEEGEGGNNGGGNGSTGGSSTCKYDGKEIPCTGPGGSVWSSKYACWIGERGPDDMVPPEGQTKEDGWWHVCYFPPPGSSWEYMWIESGEVGINPVVLAERAIASMDLDPIKIGIVPESGANRAGLVGLPVWMWVDSPTEDTFGPITRSASEGSVSVSATASVSNVVWDMGDGTKVTCTGKGTPYADHYGKQPSPTCGHRYAKMSSAQPDGAYQVTATSHWVVEWTGGGQSGTIEFDLTTDPLPIRIGEAQVLTQ
ncbi:hypothetical protein BJ993_002002 [Nocardioides aromaticivorans]|uniref:ATP/GTP-binding protein n=1 Tax=Nocardioides aromaticivorans TaxID=200618 RepID=A0A7Y9ZGD6_9ACTN|nr:hypothetical protein [Nocardioides aromaticivorans]NYI44922.1 hypothetical protein [Nocardioides aromaticivorans]